MKAAILGSTGYTGMLLLRILDAHPEVKEVLPVSSSRPGEDLFTTDPGLDGSMAAKVPGGAGGGARLFSLEEAEKGKPDVVFSCLPHLESAAACARFFGRSVVVDLSADFRLQDAAIFRQAYGAEVPRPELLPHAVYGLTEWRAQAIRKSDLIANPGCYPTASLLPLLPLAREALIRPPVVINAISGVSGAGRKARQENLFCERGESTAAYAPGRTHRHFWEIEAELVAGGYSGELFFTPHVAPLKRGIAATITARAAEGCTAEAVQDALKRAYGDCPCIHLTGSRIPETRHVWGSNRCDIGFQLQQGYLFLFSAIDNLIKGASGQAVQNMNLRFGLPETMGLRVHGEV